MLRKKRMFARPRKAYEASRIKEENALVEKYGLKNKREIWKTLAKANYFRGRAMELARKTPEEQEALFKKLRAMGLNIHTTADVLALKVENLLERRLPTVVFKRGLANTAKEARQMITHKRILINGKAVNSPSYLVSVTEESSISLKKSKVKVDKAQSENVEGEQQNE